MKQPEVCEECDSFDQQLATRYGSLCAREVDHVRRYERACPKARPIGQKPNLSTDNPQLEL